VIPTRTYCTVSTSAWVGRKVTLENVPATFRQATIVAPVRRARFSPLRTVLYYTYSSTRTRSHGPNGEWRRNTIINHCTTMSNTTTTNKYAQDGPEAKEIAQYLPYFPFKGIPRFYDIGGFLYEPKVFQQIVEIFTQRYIALEIDVICGLDARGFVLGPPIALAMKKPFVMMRKAGKMPNTITSDDYKTEYGKRSGLTVQKDKIKEGQRVLIIDDLVATGGTLSSAISLVKMLKGTVVECACVVELKMFIDPPQETGLPSRTKLFQELGHADVPVWGLISEDVLTNEAKLPDGYVDDGEEH
jgi:adenine phosphoribosyltransferase